MPEAFVGLNGDAAFELAVLVAAVAPATPAADLNALLFRVAWSAVFVAGLKATWFLLSVVALGDSTERSEGSFIGPFFSTGLASVPGAGLKGLISPASIALISFIAVAVLKLLLELVEAGTSSGLIFLTGPR